MNLIYPILLLGLAATLSQAAETEPVKAKAKKRSIHSLTNGKAKRKRDLADPPSYTEDYVDISFSGEDSNEYRPRARSYAGAGRGFAGAMSGRRFAGRSMAGRGMGEDSDPGGQAGRLFDTYIVDNTPSYAAAAAAANPALNPYHPANYNPYHPANAYNPYYG